ncbi:MAG: hypothetical protein WCO57_05460 [Verrucomicrobiota bacterium]
MTAPLAWMFACCMGSLAAEEPATIKANGKAWTLENDSLKALVLFQDGSIDLTRLFIKNDDSRERVISSSDILALNVPAGEHTLDYVPWQTKWASTTEGLEKAKRNCLLRYADGDGLAILPENNWCTSLAPAAEKGDPNNPFLFMNVLAGGDEGVRIFTNPTAVQLTLFPHERSCVCRL